MSALPRILFGPTRPVAAAVRLHQQADDAGRAELVRMAADDPEGYERLIDDAVAEMLG